MNWTLKHKKILAPLALVLFAAGLAAAIIGMNITGTVGTVLQIAGNAAFLAGLFFFGMIWMAGKRSNEESKTEK